MWIAEYISSELNEDGASKIKVSHLGEFPTEEASILALIDMFIGLDYFNTDLKLLDEQFQSLNFPTVDLFYDHIRLTTRSFRELHYLCDCDMFNETGYNLSWTFRVFNL